MNSLSKDIFPKICSLLDKKDVLVLRTMSKRLNRLIAIYVYKHYYFNLKKIIPEFFNFSGNFFETQSETIVSKIKRIHKLLINDNATTFSNSELYSLFENVQNIKIYGTSESEKDYQFLSNISNCIFPKLESIKTLDIQNLIRFRNFAHASISNILGKMPNIQNLTCTLLEIDLSSIPKIKYLKIRRFTHLHRTNNILITFNHIINFEHLEVLVIDSICVFKNISATIHMPNLKSICIKEKLRAKPYIPIEIESIETILKKLIFNPAKLEYLEFGCQTVMDIFLQIYSNDTLKSLKKMVLPNH